MQRSPDPVEQTFDADGQPLTEAVSAIVAPADDQITGGALGDLIFGGDEDDFLNGGFGFDRMNGGIGADRFSTLASRITAATGSRISPMKMRWFSAMTAHARDSFRSTPP